jgi:predicted dienelactone hydrolase
MRANVIVAIGIGMLSSSCASPSTDPPSGVDASGTTQIDAPGSDPADAADSPPTISDPTQPGPWKVGVRTVELVDGARDRSLPVDVWYPVDPATADGTDNTYVLDSLLGPLAEVDSPALRDATPAAGGPFPAVAFSHGFGGIRFQSYFLTEHLASHGFVVIAPDHPGNTLGDFAELGNDDAAAQSAMDRPLDMIFVVDRLIAGTTGVPVAIDPARIAITGHSFGGWTSLEVARRDPRFRVVLPMAPGFRNGSTPDFVADLQRPLAIFGGSVDDTCEFPANQQVPYEIAAPPKVLVEVLGAGHLDFSNLCEVPLAAQLVDDGCDPASIDPVVVHARVRAIATAFARRYLDDEPGWEPYLDPAWVSGLGDVTYWRAQ